MMVTVLICLKLADLEPEIQIRLFLNSMPEQLDFDTGKNLEVDMKAR